MRISRFDKIQGLVMALLFVSLSAGAIWGIAIENYGFKGNIMGVVTWIIVSLLWLSYSDREVKPYIWK